MNTHSLVRVHSYIRSAQARWSRSAVGWPAMVGTLAFIAGLVLLCAASILFAQADALLAGSSQPSLSRNAAPHIAQVPARSQASVPPYAARLDDVGLLFKMAKEQNVNLGSIDYRSAPVSSVPVLVREFDLRLNEEYPKFKAFLAELLKQMPNLYVREIQVELGTGTGSNVKATLKLAAVYQTLPAEGRSSAVSLDLSAVAAPAVEAKREDAR